MKLKERGWRKEVEGQGEGKRKLKDRG